jgi:hypothetical protein
LNFWRNGPDIQLGLVALPFIEIDGPGALFKIILDRFLALPFQELFKGEICGVAKIAAANSLQDHKMTRLRIVGDLFLYVFGIVEIEAVLGVLGQVVVGPVFNRVRKY